MTDTENEKYISILAKDNGLLAASFLLSEELFLDENNNQFIFGFEYKIKNGTRRM